MARRHRLHVTNKSPSKEPEEREPARLGAGLTGVTARGGRGGVEHAPRRQGGGKIGTSQTVPMRDGATVGQRRKGPVGEKRQAGGGGGGSATARGM